MNKLYCFISFMLALAGSLQAQNCVPRTTCDQAPLVCGYALEHDIFDNNVSHLEDFNTNCLIDPHNSVWFQVMTCSDSLSLNLHTLTSQSGNGLQVALFEACGTVSIACNEGMVMGAGLPLSLNAHVQPGHLYWIVVDGWDSDVCTFTFEVLSGIDTSQPSGPGGPFDGHIDGPTTGICSLGGGNYTVDWPECSTWHGYFGCQSDSCVCIHWQIPPGAAIIGDECSKSVYISFAGVPPGTYTIKATPECKCANNVCPECEPVCCPVNPAVTVVTITGPAQVNLPDSLICFDGELPDCVYDPGNVHTGTQGICYTREPATCTIYKKRYLIQPLIFTNIGVVFFCDSFNMCGQTYTMPGQYQATCTSSTGCDSLVNFVLIREPGCRFTCSDFNEPAPPGETCDVSPFFCGNHLEHYCSSNAGLAADTINGQAYPAAGFIRFAPCADSLDLRIGVDNCSTSANTLRFSLYEGRCLPDSFLRTTAVSELEFRHLHVEGLHADSTYTLLISGVNGSECAFSIEAINGIGTATPMPGQCDCTDGQVTGPALICPGDVYTYTIDPPQCTITPGTPIGGNGQFCLPPDACPGSNDSLVIHWHIPPGTHFVGDSTGLSVDIRLDSSYFNLDTLRFDSVWVDWTVVHNPVEVDSLVFCDCLSSGCSGGKVSPQYVTIKHEIHHEFCEINCYNPLCIFNGQVYTVPGNYVVAEDNCSITTLQVSFNFSPPFVPAIPPQTICRGESAVLLVPNIPGWYIVSWSDGGSGNPHLVAPLNTQSYSVTITNPASGCTAAGNTTVVVNQVPIVVLSQVHLCPGETINICGEQIGGAGIHQVVCQSWLGCDSIIQVHVVEDPMNIIQHGIVATLTCAHPCQTFMGVQYCAPGDYVLPDGCDEHHFTINQNTAIPSLDAVADPDEVCAGQSVTLTASSNDPGVQLSWADVDNGINYPNATVVVTPPDTTLYAATAINPQNGCLQTQQIHVYVHAPEIVDLGEIGQLTCNTPCINYNGTTYCNTGNYIDSTNCTISKFSIGFQKETMEHGVVATLNCLDTCFNYLGQDYCAAGDYLVEDSCFIHHFSIGTDQILPSISIVTDSSTVCIGDSTTLLALSDDPGFLFQWTNLENDSIFTGSMIKVALPDTAHFEIRVTNPQNHCTSTTQFEVDIRPFDVVDLGTVGAISCDTPCFEYQGITYCLPGNYADTAHCTISNFNIAFVKTVLDHGTVGVLNCQDTCIVFMGQTFCQPGDYTLEDSCHIHHFHVASDFTLPVCTTPQHECLSNNTQFTVAFSITGQPPFKVNDVTLGGSAFLSPPMPNGTQYLFRVKQANGCFILIAGTHNCASNCATDPGALSEQPLSGCAGQSVLTAQSVAAPAMPPGSIVEYRLQSMNGQTLEWNTSGEFEYDGNQMQPDVPYRIIRVVGPPGADGRPDPLSPCTDSTNGQQIIFSSIPELVNLVVQGPKCPEDQDGSARIEAVEKGSAPYLFTLDQGVASALSAFSGLSPGVHSIQITDSLGCHMEQPFTIPPAPAGISVDLGADREINIGQSVILHAELSGAPASISWTSDNGLSSQDSTDWLIAPLQTTQVKCAITDTNGCVSRDEILVFVKTEANIYRPNVLAPDGNSIENQHFTFYAAPGWITRIKSLSVYDRWGELLWQKQDFPANIPGEGWDGSFRGAVLQPGVYIYRAELELATGAVTTLTGDITLIR